MATAVEKEISKFYKNLLIPLAKHPETVAAFTSTDSHVNLNDLHQYSAWLYDTLNSGGHAFIYKQSCNWILHAFSTIRSITYKDGTKLNFNYSDEAILEYLVYYYQRMNFRLDDITHKYSGSNGLFAELYTINGCASQVNVNSGYNGILDNNLTCSNNVVYAISDQDENIFLCIKPEQFLTFKANNWAHKSYAVEWTKDFNKYTRLFWATEEEAQEFLTKVTKSGLAYLQLLDHTKVTKLLGSADIRCLSIAINIDGAITNKFGTAYVNQNSFIETLNKARKWNASLEDY